MISLTLGLLLLRIVRFGGSWRPGRTSRASEIGIAILMIFGTRHTLEAADPLDSWVEGETGVTNQLNAITYGDGLWIAAGELGTIVTSTNGVGWVQREYQDLVEYRGVAFGGGHFVAVGSVITNSRPAEVIVTSEDGVNWRPRTTGILTEHFSELDAVAYGEGGFMAMGRAERSGISVPIVLRSTNGMDWTELELKVPLENIGITYGSSSVAFGNGSFVLVGHTDVFTNRYELLAPFILSSRDGISWAEGDSGISATNVLLSTVTQGKNQFVAGGGSLVSYPRDCCYWRSSIIVSSTDGTTWQERFESGSQQDQVGPFIGSAYGSGAFVCIGLSTGWPIATSTDGINWISRQIAPKSWTINAIAYGDGRFVVVGGAGKTFRSGVLISLRLEREERSGVLGLSLEGPNRLRYTIETSSDLSSWQTLTNMTSGVSGLKVGEPLFSASGQIFYRAVLQGNE